MSAEEIKNPEVQVEPAPLTTGSTLKEQPQQPFNLSEEINALVKEKVELERRKIKEEILAADRQLQEAKANEIFENEFKTNSRLQTRQATMDRLIKDLATSFDELNILVEEGRYYKSIFEFTEPRYKNIRKLCYAAKTLGSDFLVKRFMDNLEKSRLGI